MRITVSVSRVEWDMISIEEQREIKDAVRAYTNNLVSLVSAWAGQEKTKKIVEGGQKH